MSHNAVFFFFHASPNQGICTTCEIPGTAEHILWAFPRFKNERQILRDTLPLTYGYFFLSISPFPSDPPKLAKAVWDTHRHFISQPIFSLCYFLPLPILNHSFSLPLGASNALAGGMPGFYYLNKRRKISGYYIIYI